MKKRKRIFKVEFEVEEIATDYFDGRQFFSENPRMNIKGHLKSLTDYDEFRKVTKIKIRISKQENS